MIDFINEQTMIKPNEAEAMNAELQKLPRWGRLLELGTGFGHSISYFSQIKPDWTHYTVDGYGVYGDGRNLFNGGEFGFKVQGFTDTYTFIEKNANKNVILLFGNSCELPWELPLNALFIDADHSEDWVKNDTEHYLEMIVPGGLIIYHDYNDNWGVKKYFDKEMIDREGWETWDKEGLAFAKRTK